MQEKNLHPDLLLAKELVYEPNGLICKNIKKEAESDEYGAYEFEINDHRIKFRASKITPTKIGQFVTLWKRIGNGPIMPYDLADPIDFFVVSTRSAEHFGQFIFPKSVLFRHGIISKETKGGKRAIRVYPPWDIAQNQQAKKTQKWQLEYFFEIREKQPVGRTNMLNLFSPNVMP
ncbi:MAG: MepB family protein [Gammaproteobacteria bacterium]|nr:MepB family protein [Gammaproteobacteria bacterium]